MFPARLRSEKICGRVGTLRAWCFECFTSAAKRCRVAPFADPKGGRTCEVREQGRLPQFGKTGTEKIQFAGLAQAMKLFKRAALSE